MDLPLDLYLERTEYADECYAAIGRALTFATRFEGNCRAFAGLVGLKEGKINLESEEDIKAFSESLTRTPLSWHIKGLVKRFKFPSDITEVIHSARKARNFIAHELTVGISNLIETDDREIILSGIEQAIREIAEADSKYSHDRLAKTLKNLEEENKKETELLNKMIQTSSS